MKIIVLLKYLSNFFRIPEMPLINYEINSILIWHANCFRTADPVDNQAPTFALADTKLCIPVVTLSTQGSAKLLQQLK